MPQAPTLTDGTVTIRAHRPDDVQRMWEQCQDPLSQQWTTIPVPYSHADANDFLAAMPQRWESGSTWIFAVEYDGRYGGTIELRDEGDARAEVAYGSHPDIRGKGVMERALRLLLQWGFEEKRLETVIWWANIGNWGSRKLAWRLGFSLDGTVRHWLPQRGELHDGWVGTLTRGEAMKPRSTWLDCPVVTGDDVVLRPLRVDDGPRLVEGSADPEAQYWLADLPRDPGPEYGTAYVETAREACATGTGVVWAISATSDGPLLGTVGLFRIRHGRDAEVGYWIHPDSRGRGLATRAARLAVAHGFGVLGLARIAAYHTEGNVASERVLERIGLRRTGVQRRDARTGDGGTRDLVAFDLLREEWPTRPDEVPRLVGDRVVLRPLRDEDVPRIAEAGSDPVIQHWFGSFPSPYGEEDAREFVRRTRRRAGEIRRWAVADRESDLFLGVITLFDIEPELDAEVGYWLHPDARGRGIATEMARLAASYAFDTLGLVKLKASAPVDNAASRRVLEKLGMTQWGRERHAVHVRAGYADAGWYDITREEHASIVNRS